MKPFTKRDMPRIRRVCDVIREHLGITNMAAQYRISTFNPKMTAGAFISRRGWTCHIDFCDDFFKHSLDAQINVLIHEHIHVLLHPMHQASMKIEDALISSKHQKVIAQDITETAAEITIDLMVGPLRRLLDPYIQKALRARNA